ncbi:hypothetical protein C3L33_02406, partial [Rhododendron williamsianum]
MGSLPLPHPHIVEDCQGILQLYSDGSITRSNINLLSFFNNNPPYPKDDDVAASTVLFKDCLYQKPHHLRLRLYKPKNPPSSLPSSSSSTAAASASAPAPGPTSTTAASASPPPSGPSSSPPTTASPPSTASRPPSTTLSPPSSGSGRKPRPRIPNRGWVAGRLTLAGFSWWVTRPGGTLPTTWRSGSVRVSVIWNR